MEKEIDMGNKIESRDLQEAEQLLFRIWLDQEILNDVISPTINQENFKDILVESRHLNGKVVGLAPGCQQFAEVSGDNGLAVNTVKELDTSIGSRADRFAQALSLFQQAFLSWGIEFKIFMTMSDMEGNAFIHNHKSQGMFQESRIKQIMNSSLREMSSLVSKHGGNIEMFSHIEALKELLNVDDFSEVLRSIGFISGDFSRDVDIHKMLWRLYETDPIILIQWLKQKTLDPIVWFDLMSPLAGEHRIKLQKEIIKNHPNMPILSLIRNAGKWETPSEAHQIFLGKERFISNILGISSDPNDRNLWIREVMSKDDDILERFLRELGLNVNIIDVESKNKAIGILERLTFGQQSLKTEGIQLEEILLPKQTNIKEALSDKLNKSRSHIFNLIKSGAITINEERLSSNIIQVNQGDILQVGKKTKFVININEG